MSKALKPIIIAAVVILVMVIALILLVYVFPAKSDDTPAAEATATPASTSVKIISEDDTTLKSFELLPDGGDSMLVRIHRDSDGNLSYTVEPSTQYFEYDTSKFRSMIYTLTSMSATNFVEENAKDLSVYGLDKPWFTVRLTFDGGRVLELYLGNATPTDNNYYCTTNESKDVYTLGNYVVGLITRSDIDYRNITLFPVYEDDDIYANINYVKLTQRDGTVIEIRLEDTDNMGPLNVTSSAYYMLQPVEGSCNDTIVKEDVMDVVAALTSSSVLCDITEDEYPEYGFDNPAALEMTDVDGNRVSILVGKKYSSSQYYVMLEQSPETVILCPAEAFAWLDLNYITLMNRITWYENITNIDHITYDLDGTEYVLSMTHGTRTTDDGKEKATVEATLNGDPISETNARRLFVRTLNFRIIGDIPSDAKTGKAMYTITMTLLDGTERPMKFYKLNERQFAVDIEGTMQFYVYKKNITTLLDAFDTVLAGKELEMNYDS